MLFFFNHPATPEIYTLSLHDALPISHGSPERRRLRPGTLRAHAGPAAGRLRRARGDTRGRSPSDRGRDRKSTRLNSSHQIISYAVFCLKKKKTNKQYNINMMKDYKYA